MEPRGGRSRRRSSVKGLVAVARPENDRRLTRGSRPHEESLARSDKPGRLAFLRATALPGRKATVRLDSTGSIEEATLGEAQGEPAVAKGPEGLHRVEFTVESKSKDEPLFLMFRVRTGKTRGRSSSGRHTAWRATRRDRIAFTSTR